MSKILLIEDDPAILLGVSEYLTSQGYEVLISEDGKKGFEYALQEIPDLVLLDIMLPSLNGLEVCRKLRENNFSNPIIILTSMAERVDKIVGLEIGADDYVTKPFDPRELLARIRANLRRVKVGSFKSDSYEKANNLQRHLLSVMFSDMQDYSKKMNRDERLTLELLKIHNCFVKESVEKNDGKVVEIIGDAFLSSFERAADALKSSIDIQNKFRDYNSDKSTPKKERMNLRLGIHIGYVFEFEGKLKGDALNIAARIQQLAEPGSIYISSSFYSAVKGKTDNEFKSLGKFELKNIKGQVELYEVII